MSKAKTRKVCPPKKPLYNPKTDRCVMDTPLNRKKISLLKESKPKPPTPKPQPKLEPKPHKILCHQNTCTKQMFVKYFSNLKKLGLEFKQKTETMKKTKEFKQLSAHINVDSSKADLLENFDKVLDNIWHGSMYKLLIAMYYVLKRHKNACFLSADVNTPQKRIDYEKFNIMYKKDRRFYPYSGMDIVYRKDDKNKQPKNITLIVNMMVQKL